MTKLRKDLTGKTFGYLDVIEFAGRRASKALWLCRCRCGAEIQADGYNLSSGHTTSCGCRRKEAPAANIIHGLSKTRAHRIWRKMLERCNNPKARHFEDYGGRGIKVCERWREFTNFYADMGDPPDGLSIDREDNDGDYTPENCRWATDLQQAANKRTTHRIERDGVTLTITEWCERLGLKRNTVEKRIAAGWPKERWLDPLVPKVITSRDAAGRVAAQQPGA